MLSRTLNRLVMALAILAASAAVAGCGSSGNSGGGPAPGSSAGTAAKLDPKVAAELPAAIKKKGTIKVASDASYAPVESFAPDGKTIVGIDPDLGKALGTVMGVKLQFQNATFDGIIPGLSSGKYDLGMSAFTDNKEREKTVDFVTYLTAGESFYVKSQGGPAINGLADLCGHKVAAEKGTVEATDAAGQTKKCTAAGKPAVKVLVFPDQNGANLALSSGRADVGFADSPIAEYQVKKTGGQFKVSGPVLAAAPYGIAVPKKSGLQKPLLDAVSALIQGGQYKAILKKWGTESGAIATPKLNGATS